jgi:hypothetical protein
MTDGRMTPQTQKDAETMVRRSRSRLRTLFTTGFAATTCLVICGFSVGWLAGLSVSPVLQAILASVLGVLAAILSAITGIKIIANPGHADELSDSEGPNPQSTDIQVNPIPLAAFTVFLALGASLGILARTNDLLGPQPNLFARRWHGTGIESSRLQSQLLFRLYSYPQDVKKSEIQSGSEPPQAKLSGESSDPRNAQLTAGLFSASADDCQLLALKRGDELRTRLLAVAPEQFQQPLQQCKGEECLEFARRVVCPDLH